VASLASGPCGGAVRNFVPTEVVSRQFDVASGELVVIEIVATSRGDASGFVKGLKRDLGVDANARANSLQVRESSPKPQ
jgi:hypothetical protein